MEIYIVHIESCACYVQKLHKIAHDSRQKVNLEDQLQVNFCEELELSLASAQVPTEKEDFPKSFQSYASYRYHLDKLLD